MKNEFVTPKIAQDLKDMGFDEECGALYRHGRLFPISGFEKINSIKQSVVGAALWQQVIDFFRKKYKITIILIPSNYFDSEEFSFKITCNNRNHMIGESSDNKYDLFRMDFKNYEEAREKAIEKAIEIIKEQNDE